MPIITPTLMIGYCYRDTALALIHWPVAKELLYSMIVLTQVTAIETVLLWLAPIPEVSASAVYSARLTKLPWKLRAQLWMRAQGRSLLAAWGVGFLLSFQEAELASLLQATGWTEWLFTKQATGLMLSATVRYATWPVLIQLPVVVLILRWLVTLGASGFKQSLVSGHEKSWQTGLLWAGWFAGIIMVSIIPAVQMLRTGWRGMSALSGQPGLPREVGDALLVAATTGGLAVTLAAWILSRGHSHDRGGPLLAFLLVPGCVGTLALGIMLSFLFQTKPLAWAYDSPVPLILGGTLSLLPRAVVVLKCLSTGQRDSGFHWGQLLRASSSMAPRAQELDWRTWQRRWVPGIALICWWGYLEPMLPSLLAMPGLSPVSLVMYNAMHYGRIALVATKLMVATLLPVLVIGGLLFAWEQRFAASRQRR